MNKSISNERKKNMYQIMLVQHLNYVLSTQHIEVIWLPPFCKKKQKKKFLYFFFIKCFKGRGFGRSWKADRVKNC